MSARPLAAEPPRLARTLRLLRLVQAVAERTAPDAPARPTLLRQTKDALRDPERPERRP